MPAVLRGPPARGRLSKAERARLRHLGGEPVLGASPRSAASAQARSRWSRSALRRRIMRFARARWLIGRGARCVARGAAEPSPLAVQEDEEEGMRLSLAGTRTSSGFCSKDADRNHAGPPAQHPHHQEAARRSSLDWSQTRPTACRLPMRWASRSRRSSHCGPPAREALLVSATTGIVRDRMCGDIHQEDFCQASGLPPEAKYEAEGGPGVADCGALIGADAGGRPAQYCDFSTRLLFNVVIGNADAHSKNYSLLLEGPGGTRLAPLYDLISTRAYGRRYGRKMGMKYGGEYRPETDPRPPSRPAWRRARRRAPAGPGARRRDGDPRGALTWCGARAHAGPRRDRKPDARRESRRRSSSSRRCSPTAAAEPA